MQPKGVEERLHICIHIVEKACLDRYLDTYIIPDISIHPYILLPFLVLSTTLIIKINRIQQQTLYFSQSCT